MKSMPLRYRRSFDPQTSSGRPEDAVKAEAFDKVIHYFNENDDEQLPLSDLCSKMKEYLNGGIPNTERYMKTKLQDHFGDNIIITCIRGKRNIVTHRVTAEKILEKFSKTSQEKDIEKEKLRIIGTAAKLILSDISNIDISKDEYPPGADVGELSKNLEFLPNLLLFFLNTTLKGKKNVDLKKASIGQCLVQAARPKVLIAPLQIGLGVSIHYQTGSRHLVDTLCSLGFSSSYDEVHLFKLSAALNQKTELIGVGPDSWIQFVSDNVDHQIKTLDGIGTFHGMGIIAASTPGLKDNKSIRRDVSATPEKVSRVVKMRIRYFDSSTVDLSLAYGISHDFNFDDKVWKLDLLWKISCPLRSPRPGWFGFMQSICTGYAGQSSFTFLPVVDMDPKDMSCIYSILHFMCSLAEKYKSTPILTFDQPLWWKATIIIDSEPQNSVLRSIIPR